LPMSVRVAVGRGNAVKRCLRWRKMIKEGPHTLDDGTYVGADDLMAGLRRDQMLLLRLRIWRATGTYPSNN
jgi:hypothetical protein